MLDVAPIWMPDVQQQNYRALLEAMSRPGSIESIQGNDTEATYLAVLATLLDGEVSLSDPSGLLSESNWPLLQSQRASTYQADYILCQGDQPPSFRPRLGTLPCPEQSATLVIQVESLTTGNLHLRLSGPGVKDTEEVNISGLHSDWLAQREDWVCAFPLGVDMILVDETAAMALPRTTKVEIL